MKYPLLAICYSLLWIFLSAYLVVERSLKGFSIIVLMIWHIRFKRTWFERFGVIDFVIPFPIIGLIFDYEIKWNMKDYFLLHNWNDKFHDYL